MLSQQRVDGTSTQPVVDVTVGGCFGARKKKLLSIDEGGGDDVFGLTLQPDETTTAVRSVPGSSKFGDQVRSTVT